MSNFAFGTLLPLSALGAGAILGQANYNLPLDRPYTLRGPDPLVLEAGSHRMTSGGRMSFILPRACVSALDSTRVCGDAHGFSHLDSGRDRSLNVSPMGAYSYRHSSGEHVHALEAGGLATGHNGPLSFYLDARMFTEKREDPSSPSFDRESVETQDEDASGSVAYSSYSRYRANLSYDTPWGRLSAGRDAAHWGPSLYNSLVFSQMAVPFNQAGFTTHIGPVAVHTLYGSLAVEGDRIFSTEPGSRSIYAHRYEWTVTDDLLLGMSEQLIVSGREEPFALLPVVPLFIFKGDAWERVNNGNLAVDVCYRIPGTGRVYSEFLIDDMQSPTSLFDDQWGNKWGWTAGFQLIAPILSRRAGMIAEYSRIEPWVYTHYRPATAQAANLGQPLGSQQGPNSQTMALSFYLLASSRWNLAYTAGMAWKGTDPGSNQLDLPGPSLRRKEFLAGGPGPQGSHLIRGHYQSGRLGLEGWLRATESVTVSVRLVFAH